MKSEKQQLIDLLEGMSKEQQRSLLDYAGFLKQKSQQAQQDDTPEQKLQPIRHERPEQENVINAIKRLRASYFMLNTDGLLNETSTLMTQFIVHGRNAGEVIDDLEALFENHFQKYLQL